MFAGTPHRANASSSALPAVAASAVKSPIHSTPPFPTAHLSAEDELALSEYHMKGHTAAIGFLNRKIASQKGFDCHKLIIERAHCSFRLDEYNAALRDCEAALKIQPRNAAATLLRCECFLGLRRYDEFKGELQKLTRRDDAHITAHHKPLFALWSQYQLEQQGQYDISAMMEETISKLSSDTSDSDLTQVKKQMSRPCARLSPHADYLHPAVECAVAIKGKGRGIRVRNSAAASSSVSTFSSSSGCLPKHSLVMSMKAIVAHLDSDDVARPTLLLRKLKDQPHLVSQVQRLFGDATREADRTKLLLVSSAETTWRAPTLASSLAASLNVDQQSALTATLRHNPFGDSFSSSNGDGGSGLFFLPSFFNHSCVPNCVWQLIGDQMFVRTIRDVAAGEELTIAYRNCLNLPFDERQQLLKSTWGFSCGCDSCAVYVRRPSLLAAESTLLSKCVDLQIDFNNLTSAAWTWRITKVESLNALMTAHANFISTLPEDDQRLMQIPLRQCWFRLSRMLHEVLILMPRTDARFPALLKRHQQACQECADILQRWDMHISEWSVILIDQLCQQSHSPKEATMSIAQQEAVMCSIIRNFACHYGLPVGVHFLTEHSDDLKHTGLTQMYQTCLAQLQEENREAGVPDA